MLRKLHERTTPNRSRKLSVGDPLPEQVDVLGWPSTVTRHVPDLEPVEDIAGMGRYVCVTAEVELPDLAHRINIPLPEKRQNIRCIAYHRVIFPCLLAGSVHQMHRAGGGAASLRRNPRNGIA